MTGALIMLGVIVGGAAVMLIAFRRRGGPTTNLVLLAAAGGEAEAQLWSDRLRSVGIKARIANVGDSAWMTSPYAYEVWVRPRDEQLAREILGL